MAQITQVLLYSALFLSVYSEDNVDDHSLQEEQRTAYLFALSKLFQNAARLAYPITLSINKAVDTLRDSKNFPFLSRQSINSNETHPVHDSGRGGRNRENERRKSLRADLENQHRVNGQVVNRRKSDNPASDDYEDDYEHDYDSRNMENYYSSEVGDDFFSHNSRVQLKTVPNKLSRKTYPTEHIRNVPKRKSAPRSIPPAEHFNNTELKLRKPFAKPALEVKNIEHSNKRMTITLKKARNNLNPSKSKLRNHDNQPRLKTHPIEKKSVSRKKGITLPGNNLKNKSPGIDAHSINDNTTHENVLLASNGAKAKIINVGPSPDGSNPASNKLNNQRLNANEDDR